MRLLFYFSLLLLFFTACQRAEPVQQEFPILRMHNASLHRYSTDALRLEYELVKIGTTPYKELAFAFQAIDPPSNTTTFSIGPLFREGQFSAVVQNNLIAGATYEVALWAFVGDFTDEKVISNTVELFVPVSPVDLWKIAERDRPLPGFSTAQTVFFDNQVYVVNGTGQTHAINPSDLRIEQVTATTYPNDSLFFLVNGTQDLFFINPNGIHQFSNGSWTALHASIPYDSLHPVCFGFQQGQQLFTINQYGTYAFDLTNETWSAKASYPDTAATTPIAGVYFENKAYVLNSQNILWSFDPFADHWEPCDTFPSSLLDFEKAESFSFGGNIWFCFPQHESGTYRSHLIRYAPDTKNSFTRSFPFSGAQDISACPMEDKILIIRGSEPGLVDLFELNF
jgi:hypothetical protein